MRNRTYDPRTGRFLQVDPLLRNKATDHYVYCSNNPVMRIDPWGLDDEEEELKDSFWGVVNGVSSWLEYILIETGANIQYIEPPKDLRITKDDNGNPIVSRGVHAKIKARMVGIEIDKMFEFELAWKFTSAMIWGGVNQGLSRIPAEKLTSKIFKELFRSGISSWVNGDNYFRSAFSSTLGLLGKEATKKMFSKMIGLIPEEYRGDVSKFFKEDPLGKHSKKKVVGLGKKAAKVAAKVAEKGLVDAIAGAIEGDIVAVHKPQFVEKRSLLPFWGKYIAQASKYDIFIFKSRSSGYATARVAREDKENNRYFEMIFTYKVPKDGEELDTDDVSIKIKYQKLRADE